MTHDEEETKTHRIISSAPCFERMTWLLSHVHVDERELSKVCWYWRIFLFETAAIC